MATTFDDNERSSSQSRPRDLWIIVTPTFTYRHTSHVVDVVYAGDTYTALTMSRGSISVDPAGKEMTLYLPITHPVVQRYFAIGIPEQGVIVTSLRLQEVSGTAQQQGSGFAQSIAIDGNVAMIRIPPDIDDAIKIRLPVVRTQKLCNHVLFDERCSPPTVGDGPSQAAFSFFATISSQSGQTMVVSTMSGNPDGWAKFGRIIHTTSAQTRTISDQIGAVLTINAPLSSVDNGSEIIVVAGCGHTLTICKSKFNNVNNFGGHPHLNSAVNPYYSGGLGIITQA